MILNKKIVTSTYGWQCSANQNECICFLVLGAYHAHPWTRRDSESGGSGQKFPPSVLQVSQQPIMPIPGPEEHERAVLWTEVFPFSATGNPEAPLCPPLEKKRL